MIAIILAILAFGVLIFVHELGHFTLAKLNGVKVNEFALGMGPQIYSIKGKETTYSLRLFPIGGFVDMMGENEEVDDERSFSQKSPLRRISIIIAGVVMNYVLAIVIFTVLAFKFGYTDPVINTVQENSPAQTSGILEGDKILKVGDMRVFTANDVTSGIYLAKGETINFELERNGEIKEIQVTPENRKIEVKDEETGEIKTQEKYIVGVSFKVVEPGLLTSIKHGLIETKAMIYQTYKSLQMMVTGKINFKTDVGGPVTIIKMSTATAKTGIWNLIYFVAVISVNLAVFNLLPFPALDGGWTVILLIELITRRKVPEKVVGIVNTVGFAILMGFMLLVTIKDFAFPINF